MAGINLKRYIGGGIDTIFEQLSQIVEKVRIIEIVGDKDEKGKYNPRTGKFDVDEDYDRKEERVNAIRLDLDLKDANKAVQTDINDKSVEFADSQFLIKESSIKDVSITSYSQIDQFKEDGVTLSRSWRVVEVRLDPTQSFYEIFVRDAI